MILRMSSGPFQKPVLRSFFSHMKPSPVDKPGSMEISLTGVSSNLLQASIPILIDAICYRSFPAEAIYPCLIFVRQTAFPGDRNGATIHELRPIV